MTMRSQPTRSPRRRRAFAKTIGSVAALTVLALVSGVTVAVASDMLTVQMDRARVMHIARPASTVILGNPAIADATIQDRQTLILTGRSFGITNLIVLDQDGQPVAEELLTVTAPDDRLVTIYTGSTRQSFSCAPDCQPVMNLSDSTTVFTDVRGRFDSRNSFVQGAVNAGPN